MKKLNFSAGIMPGKGLYECVECNDTLIFLGDENEQLPICPNCNGTKYANISPDMSIGRVGI